jgi:hypothetical protein
MKIVRTFNIELDTYMEAKEKAAQEQRSLSSLVNEALAQYLQDEIGSESLAQDTVQDTPTPTLHDTPPEPRNDKPDTILDLGADIDLGNFFKDFDSQVNKPSDDN